MLGCWSLSAAVFGLLLLQCCFGARLQFNNQVIKAAVLFLLLCLELVALRNLETLDISINGYLGGEFTGLALITTNDAVLWTDGRYFLQVAQELSDQWKLMHMGGDPVMDVWMANKDEDEAVHNDNQVRNQQEHPILQTISTTFTIP
ncbi:Aminopeptidase P1 [Camellia lanceoleosa]|uniref:Aminopeptidase P1 n=1 Tax=Camellia lanceoleosa TaxID=1840588 RepID=A0ACC0J265_9ERIC|nr:Aminopeptidase P1 [Camellia lanceoleosa]